MKGKYFTSLHRNGWELLINDETNCYTLEFKKHEMPEIGSIHPTTLIPFDGKPILMALAQILTDMDLLPRNANSAELKATKYHLEDMRNLIFKFQPKKD